MTVRKLVERYIENAEQVFQQLEKSKRLADGKAAAVLEVAERYLKDAIYYRDQKRFDTALTSVAYCEGLLDALRLLQMVEFQWVGRKS